MERGLVNTALTPTARFYVGGVGTDPTPDAATVTVTRSDGTVVSTGAAQQGDNAGEFRYTIEPAQNALLDTLTLTWASTNLGTITTTVEIVGGFLFSLAEARAVGLAEGAYSAAQIAARRTAIEQRLEDAMGVSFFPRYTVETFGSDRGYVVQPRWAFPRVIRNVWRDSATVTPVASAVTIDEGAFRFSWGWSYAYETVGVGYEHGYLTVPEYIRSAALEEAKQSLQAGSSGMDPRVASYSTDDGSVRFFEGATASGFVSTQMNQIVQNDSMRVMIA